jgi:hypothetical protein
MPSSPTQYLHWCGGMQRMCMVSLRTLTPFHAALVIQCFSISSQQDLSDN